MGQKSEDLFLSRAEAPCPGDGHVLAGARSPPCTAGLCFSSWRLWSQIAQFLILCDTALKMGLTAFQYGRYDSLNFPSP